MNIWWVNFRPQDIILNERNETRKKVKLVIGGRDYKVAATVGQDCEHIEENPG